MATVVQITRWLLTHREAAMKIYELTRNWTSELSVSDKWAIVNSVAEIVLPLLEGANILSIDADFDYDDDVELMALGSEVGALGIPWIAVTSILIPVLQIIFDFVQKEGE